MQLYRISRAFGLLRSQPVPEEVEQAIDRGCCTYTVTGNEFTPQQYYLCHTCQLVGGKGCCMSCARSCHAGHKLSVAVRSGSVLIFEYLLC